MAGASGNCGDPDMTDMDLLPLSQTDGEAENAHGMEGYRVVLKPGWKDI